MASWHLSALASWSKDSDQKGGVCIGPNSATFNYNAPMNVMSVTGRIWVVRLLRSRNGTGSPGHNAFDENDEFVYTVDLERNTESGSSEFYTVASSGNVTVRRSDMEGESGGFDRAFSTFQLDVGDKIDDMLVPDYSKDNCLRLHFRTVSPQVNFLAGPYTTDADLWFNNYDNSYYRPYIDFNLVSRDSAIGAPHHVTAPQLAPATGVPIEWLPGEPSTYESTFPDAATAYYKIYRATQAEVEAASPDDPDFTYVGRTEGAETSYVDQTVEEGETYYYKVQAISGRNGLYSVLSMKTMIGCYVNHAPEKPTFEGSAEGAIYNPRPRLLITLGSDADADFVSVAGEGFSPSKATAAPGENLIIRRIAELPESRYETAEVSESDIAGNVATASRQYHYIKPVWTDDPIVAGETFVKAVHINELRNALNNIAVHYGMEPFVWASGEVIAGTTSRLKFPVHIEELQNAVREIISYVNRWESLSSQHRIENVTMKPTLKPTADAINQLREIIVTL